MLAADAVFRERRWRRAGATLKQLDELRDAHAGMSLEEQAAEGRRVDSVSDRDLAAELEAGTTDPTSGNADEVIARVGADRELAAVVLSHESAKTRPRKTVIEAMTAIVEQQVDDENG